MVSKILLILLCFIPVAIVNSQTFYTDSCYRCHLYCNDYNQCWYINEHDYYDYNYDYYNRYDKHLFETGQQNLVSTLPVAVAPPVPAGRSAHGPHDYDNDHDNGHHGTSRPWTPEQWRNFGIGMGVAGGVILILIIICIIVCCICSCSKKKKQNAPPPPEPLAPAAAAPAPLAV